MASEAVFTSYFDYIIQGDCVASTMPSLLYFNQLTSRTYFRSRNKMPIFTWIQYAVINVRQYVHKCCGETLANRDRILQGQADTHLSDLGKKQAELVGLRLRDLKFTHMFSSDLSRAAETAKAIVESNTSSSCQLVLDSRLRERSVGVLEGKTIHEFRAAVEKSGMAYEVYTAEGAETMDQVKTRAKSFLEDLFKVVIEYDPSTSTSSNTVEDTIKEQLAGNIQSSTIVPSVSRSSYINVLSTDSLTTVPLGIHIPSASSLFGSEECHADKAQTSVSSNLPTRSSSATAMETDDGTDLDFDNILIVSHGLLLKEMTRLILGTYLGKLDGHLIKETSRISPNTGVSRYLMQVNSVNKKFVVQCLKCLVVNDVSHLSILSKDMITQFQGAA